MIRIVLGHRGRLIREAFVALLSRQEDLAVVGQSAHADELLAIARRVRPTVTMVDCALPPSSVTTAELSGRAEAGKAVLIAAAIRAAVVKSARLTCKRSGLPLLSAGPARSIMAPPGIRPAVGWLSVWVLPPAPA